MFNDYYYYYLDPIPTFLYPRDWQKVISITTCILLS